jgi:AraC family transcriptional regulator, regulatory protein of adaptative response / methylphosphotriester-DNA alkyltransferase methyltransferase
LAEVRPDTLSARHRLYLLARVVVARHYRQELTLTMVAEAVSSSPRQLQRAYAEFGETTFREDLLARRMAAAADLLIEQRSIPVADVARLAGFNQAPYFARAFRRRYGLSPVHFRERAAAGVALVQARGGGGLWASGERSQRPEARDEAVASSAGSSPASSPLGSIGSAPGRRRRILVPPPGADSAVTLPPSWLAT